LIIVAVAPFLDIREGGMIRVNGNSGKKGGEYAHSVRVIMANIKKYEKKIKLNFPIFNKNVNAIDNKKKLK